MTSAGLVRKRIAGSNFQSLRVSSSDTEQEKKKKEFSTATYSFQVLNEVTERM